MLRFQGVNGKRYTATRSFHLINKKGDKQVKEELSLFHVLFFDKLVAKEFKATEANIVEDGTKGSTSHRCGEQ